MKEFSFHAPGALPEALALFQDLGERARPLAGGTDLLLQMRAGDRAPAAVVSLRRLAELKGIQYSSQAGLRLGAYTTLRELTRDATIRSHFPCLAQTASLMGSEQVRSLATVGGNLCNGSPSADLAPPLIALGAEAHIVGPKGERQLPLEALFRAPGHTSLEPGEVLVELRVPPPQGKTLYLKHAPRAYMDIAVVGVAVSLLLENQVVSRARLVLGAVAPVPLRAREAEAVLEGAELTPQRISLAANLAQTACSPIDDLRGSADYRSRLVRVLVSRALQALRPNGGGP
jgi:carbon-monoxide dehydrogenase medium subunit